MLRKLIVLGATAALAKKAYDKYQQSSSASDTTARGAAREARDLAASVKRKAGAGDAKNKRSESGGSKSGDSTPSAS